MRKEPSKASSPTDKRHGRPQKVAGNISTSLERISLRASLRALREGADRPFQPFQPFQAFQPATVEPGRARPASEAQSASAGIPLAQLSCVDWLPNTPNDPSYHPFHCRQATSSLHWFLLHCIISVFATLRAPHLISHMLSTRAMGPWRDNRCWSSFHGLTRLHLSCPSIPRVRLNERAIMRN